MPRSIASRPRPPEAIIIGLFLLQRLGTGVVGRLSGPVMGIWFAAIGAIGVHGVAAHPEIFKALLPTYALDFLAGHFSTFQPPRGSKSMASSTKTTGSSTSPARFGHMAEPNVPGLLPLIRKALDSIPAVFGVTDQPYIVFAANAFALLGLRALFFLVTGLLDRLVYLSSGLALILAFIGAKLILHWGHGLDHRVPEITTSVSLAGIGVVLAVTTLASLIKSRRDPTARAHAGAVIGTPSRAAPDEHRPSRGRQDPTG